MRARTSGLDVGDRRVGSVVVVVRRREQHQCFVDVQEHDVAVLLAPRVEGVEH